MAYQGVYSDEQVKNSLQLPGLSHVTTGISLIQQTLTPVAVAADTSAEQNFTVPGLVAGDWVEITPPGLTAGVILGNARVSAANTLTVQFSNSTAGSLTPPAGVHSILVVR